MTDQERKNPLGGLTPEVRHVCVDRAQEALKEGLERARLEGSAWVTTPKAQAIVLSDIVDAYREAQAEGRGLELSKARDAIFSQGERIIALTMEVKDLRAKLVKKPVAGTSAPRQGSTGAALRDGGEV